MGHAAALAPGVEQMGSLTGALLAAQVDPFAAPRLRQRLQGIQLLILIMQGGQCVCLMGGQQGARIPILTVQPSHLCPSEVGMNHVLLLPQIYDYLLRVSYSAHPLEDYYLSELCARTMFDSWYRCSEPNERHFPPKITSGKQITPNIFSCRNGSPVSRATGTCTLLQKGDVQCRNVGAGFRRSAV